LSECQRNPLSASCLSCLVHDQVWELLDFGGATVDACNTASTVAPAEIAVLLADLNILLVSQEHGRTPYLLLSAVVRIRLQ
jgi:hypothetical protein